MLCLACALLLLSGCLLNRKKPPVQLPGDLPAGWVVHVKKHDLSITTTLLKLINEETLKKLVHEALENNPDLNATALRLRASGYLLSAPRSRLLPRMNAGFSKGRNNQGLDGETEDNTTIGSSQLSMNISWEMDMWGRLADGYAASKHAVLEQEYDYLFAREALTVRVIQAWIGQVVIGRSLAIETERVKVLEHIENILVERYTEGIGSMDELSTARARTEIARADQSGRKGALSRAVRGVEVLLGRYPRGELLSSDKLPAVALPPVGIPATVLLNRPDIQATLARVQAARYLSSSADKALLPELHLSGQLFKESARLDNIGGAVIHWNILGSLFQPLFQGGRIRGEARARRSEAEASLMDLHGVVIQALKEVEDALALEHELAEQSHSLGIAVQESEKSSRYYEERYRQGLEGIQSLLIAKEQEMSVKIRYNQVQGDHLRNRMDLALVLGVGLNDDSTILK